MGIINLIKNGVVSLVIVIENFKCLNIDRYNKMFVNGWMMIYGCEMDIIVFDNLMLKIFCKL